MRPLELRGNQPHRAARGAPRDAWRSIRTGQRVRFFRKSFELVGVLERWEDDSETQIANVEGWASVRLDDGSTRTLRRSGGMGPGGWQPTAKSLRNTGDLRVERLTTPTESCRPSTPMANKSVNVTIPEGLLASLDDHATATEKTRSQLVSDLIREAREGWKQKKEPAE